MIRVTLLGTAAARPTVGRNVAGICVQREGDLLLFDCGEGTQRQMMRYGTGFGIQAIFVTHLHADHFLGVIGLLRTMGLQGREETLRIYGPQGAKDTLERATRLGIDRVQFPVRVHELAEGDKVGFGEYEVEAFRVQHGTPALGFALREHPRLGRFDVEKARAMGIPEGPLYGKLHKGEPVEFDGRTILPEEVVGSPRAGRLVVYAGDTRPVPGTVEFSRGADLLIHEATFTEDEAQRAYETYHSTAKGAAVLARDAGVERLVLTHLSARYADNPAPILEEARAFFPETVVGYDGMAVELGYRSHQEGDADHG
jgi:ribonuclease Z